MIEFRTKFCKDWSSRKKTYKEKQNGLFCANKLSEFYPNTLPIIILKKSNKANYSHPSCFRPISILNALSKLSEKIILVKLKRLASANNWFSPNQHGFRSGFSTETATLSLTSLIEKNRKNKVPTCCAFLDIKSAFDAAWHPAILNCLISKNCPAWLVKLLANFLSSRTCTLSSPLASRVTDIELGCPQGSVLSPFLWNILLEDLLCLNYPFPFRFIAYADVYSGLQHAQRLQLGAFSSSDNTQ
jgi:hypothetical protein